MNPAELDPVIQSIQQFDPVVLERIHDHHYPALHRYIDFRLSDPTIVDQLTTQVFVYLAETIKRHPKSISNLQAWLFEVAARLVDQYLETHPSQKADNSSHPTQGNHPSGDESTWLKNLVRKALHQLPNDYQHILALRFCETRPVDEVARLSGLTINDVKSIQFNALLSLRELLEKEA